MPDETWQERVQFDLSCLADPGSALDCEGDQHRLVVEWKVRGHARQADFIYSLSGGLRVEDGSGREKPYRSFLTEITDLRSVAEMISLSFGSELYVDVSAASEDQTAGSAIELLSRLVGDGEFDRTRVIMLKGDAGAGKTQILRELARRQSVAFLRGQATKLLLYVNAQGRALARLDEALAVALQDLRANITYHAVPSLARWDLIVPVIDGFDELLGVSGYEDAFSSLADFLEKLRGEGQLLASARSVYYEEEFLSRADQMARSGEQAWSHVPVNVRPWSSSNQSEYLTLRVKKERLGEPREKQLRDKVESLFSGNEGFEGKPLFYAKTVDLVLHDPSLEIQDDLLTTLVDGFLTRELTEKLLDGRGSPLLDNRQLVRLLCQLAQEMWIVQTRELDADAVRLVAELTLEEEGVSTEAKEVVIERAPTLAFLTRPVGQQGVAFEHESFFFDFLAQSLVSDYFEDQTANLRVVLGASSLPDDVAERAGFHLTRAREMDSTRLGTLLTRLSEAGGAKSLRAEQIRENAGRLVLEIARRFRAEITGQEVSSVTFPGGRLAGITFRDCSFRDVEFRRTDLRNTQFLDCRARQVRLVEPWLSRSNTRLGFEGLDPERDVIGVRSAEEAATTYSPEKVADVLRSCGLAGTDVAHAHPAPKFGALVERLMHAYRRANPVCKDDQTLVGLFRDEKWPALEDALIANRIVTVERRNTGGRPKSFLRRQFLPEQIMAGVGRRQDVDPEIAAFWRDLSTRT